jgi:hypothetical protein
MKRISNVTNRVAEMWFSQYRSAQRFLTGFVCALAGVCLLTIGSTELNAQQYEYQAHMNWAAGNWDAGGSVDCPANYLALGMGNAIAAGGRGLVMRQARVYLGLGYQDAAFRLVLLTQCHSGGAQQALINAGSSQVLWYLSVMQLY